MPLCRSSSGTVTCTSHSSESCSAVWGLEPAERQAKTFLAFTLCIFRSTACRKPKSTVFTSPRRAAGSQVHTELRHACRLCTCAVLDSRLYPFLGSSLHIASPHGPWQSSLLGQGNSSGDQAYICDTSQTYFITMGHHGVHLHVFMYLWAYGGGTKARAEKQSGREAFDAL